jgi:hypothetical protein
MSRSHFQPSQPKGPVQDRLTLCAASALDSQLARLWLADASGKGGPRRINQALSRLQQRVNRPVSAGRREAVPHQQGHRFQDVSGIDREGLHSMCIAWRVLQKGPARGRVEADPPQVRQDRRPARQNVHALDWRKTKGGPKTGTTQSERKASTTDKIRLTCSSCPSFRTKMASFPTTTVPCFRTHIDSSHRRAEP